MDNFCFPHFFHSDSARLDFLCLLPESGVELADPLSLFHLAGGTGRSGGAGDIIVSATRPRTTSVYEVDPGLPGGRDRAPKIGSAGAIERLRCRSSITLHVVITSSPLPNTAG